MMVALSCGGGSNEAPDATSTPKPIPSPVAFAPEPALAYTRGDPSFEALPGATAHFGALGGAIYRIEMPDNWNGRLVLYMHGSRNFDPELSIDTPSIRGYLIRSGFAWGASSYSSNIPAVANLARDETAALWDLFAQQFGRPEYTYVTGQSLGGIASVLSAERFADRYDGALPLCGAWYSDSPVDFLVAGAFVAGVTQGEFDAKPSADIYQKIFTALEDPSKDEQFHNLLVDLTGGPRPLAKQGVDVDINVFNAWGNSQISVDTHIFGNQDIVYEIGEASGVTSDAFNAAAVRMSPGPLAEEFNVQPTGDLLLPTLTLNTTGETRVTLEDARTLQRHVESAGKDDLLVHRFVRDPYHCGITNPEWEQGLEDLIAWVEQGEKPNGEDPFVSDTSKLGEDFTRAPRIGLAEADDVPGAGKRVMVSGNVTLDGSAPRTGVITATVRGADSLSRHCALESGFIHNGRYELPVAGDEELRGCGAPGAQVFLTFDPFGQSSNSQELLDWPATGRELTFDATFSTTDPGAGRRGTVFFGEALDAAGNTLAPGTPIEAFAGDTRCGVSSVPYLFDPTFYELLVVGPEAIPSCAEGAQLSFQIDGELIDATAVHDFAGRSLTLTAR